MPTGPGGLDANGVWQYGEDDTEALASDLLNLGMGSVSTVVGGLGAPTILQVVSTTKTDTFSASVAAGATTAFTGLTATITPSAASSKIICTLQLAGHVATDASEQYLQFILTRDATPIGIGDAAGVRKQATLWSSGSSTQNHIPYAGTINYVDSPSATTSITYGVNLGHGSSATKTIYMGRQTTDADSVLTARVINTITLMEVSG